MTRPTLPPQAYTREMLTSAFNWLQTQPDSVRKIAQTPDALVGLYLRSKRYGSSNLETDAPVSAQNFISDLKNLAEGLKQFEGPVATTVSAHDGSAPIPEQARAATSAAPVPGQVRASAHPTGQSIASRPTTAASSTMFQSTSGRSPVPEQVRSAPAKVETPVVRAPSAAMDLAASALEAAQARAQVSPTFPGSPASANAYSPAPEQVRTAVSNDKSLPTGPTRLSTVQPNQLSVANPLAGLNEKSLRMIQEVKAGLNLTADSEVLNLMISMAYKNLKDLLA